MSTESVRLRGLQDRHLELGGRKRDKTTPTTEGDIGVRAQAYSRLVTTAVFHTMALEGSHDVPEQAAVSSAALMTVRDEVRHFGFLPKLFGEIVRSKIDGIRKQEKQDEEDARVAEEVARAIETRKTAMSGDWGIINAELPGDFQSEIGDPPVNWGNHATRKDAGGFEPTRRGW